MPDENKQSNNTWVARWLSNGLGLPWLQIVRILWELWQNLMSELGNSGIYETMDYESTLELLNPSGTKARFSKHKKIRYLQNNIIAYQDYAWGDGKMLLNYRTNRGVAVDQYRSGYKTYILLSLREVKNRNDVDEFHIQWDIRQGFLTRDGYWSTDISQPTKHIKINVIFPKTRPPSQLAIEECYRKRNYNIGHEAQQQLPDGRWLVSWEINKPTLYEIYVLRWNW